MADLHSKAPLDGLLKILDEQKGDRLHLATNAAPEALRKGVLLRLTVPATSNSMLRALCGSMATAHLARTAEPRASRFLYECAGVGRFNVEITGSLADDGSAQVLVVRAPTPAATQSPGSPSALTAPAAATAAEPLMATPTQATLPDPTVEHAHLPSTAASAGTGAPRPGPGFGRFDNTVIAPALAHALERGASDVHLTAERPAVARVAGRLQPLGEATFDLAQCLTPAQLAEVNSGHAVDFAASFADRRLRINAFRAECGLCLAIRILPRSAPALRTLGLPKEALLQERPPHGLILVCGHTGAGKSTTLAAWTELFLSRESLLCITLESPIEYRLGETAEHSLVRQREVGTHVQSFATGLRDALREDPDLLLIGEMRDAETAALALTAAETGHLVLSTLHARNSISAIDRIVDLFPAQQQSQVRTQLASCMRLVLSQRLLQDRSGQARVLAAEVLTINSAAAHLIREGKTEQLPTVLQAGKDSGMLPLERHLADLVQNRRLERTVARSAANNPAIFDQLCPG